MPKTFFLRFSSLDNFPPHLRGGVVAIGNFDGVHRGHHSVLQRAIDLAKEEEKSALVLTFEPHPRSVFLPDHPVDRLTPAAEKAKILELLGFDAVVEQAFTRDFSENSAEDFVKQIIVKTLAASHIVTGFDFHFGKGRQGNPTFLMEAGKRFGFMVTQEEALCDESGEVISSSRIRSLLSEGNVAHAAILLGYRYTVTSEVIGGQQIGRTLGFPTANMALPVETNLKHGIYAVRLRRTDGSLYDGVASFGCRPTLRLDNAPCLETFLFDFSEDFYGETCAVSFFDFLRAQEKFNNLDTLILQMRDDEKKARALLANARPLSLYDRNFTIKANNAR